MVANVAKVTKVIMLTKGGNYGNKGNEGRHSKPAPPELKHADRQADMTSPICVPFMYIVQRTHDTGVKTYRHLAIGFDTVLTPIQPTDQPKS